MSTSTIQQLADIGQSIWFDYIDRPLLESGKLQKLIAEGLRGMTSNPAIFNNAIGSSNDYDEKIVALKNDGKSPFEIYDELTVGDIQDATDIFKPVYEATNGLDGYVSLEINPLLANKVEDQVNEGARLAKKVNRSNVMIKVPSTPEGIEVFEELIAQGISVNVTLIFSQQQYEDVVKAYIKGLQRLDAAGGDLSKVRSVASVFVSRLDVAIDKTLTTMIENNESAEKAKELLGKAAIANAHIMFNKGKSASFSQEFKDLEAKGANWQRILWASTATKNPAYSDVKYVSELIANPTVNTLPEKTYEAFKDHGEVKEGLQYDVQDSINVHKDLNDLGIDINAITAELLEVGCTQFNEAFETLLKSIETKAAQLTTA